MANNMILNGVVSFKNKGFRFDYSTDLTLQRKVHFVQNVVASLFSDDNIYLPVIRELVFKNEIINQFTGLNLDKIFIDEYGEDYESTYGVMDATSDFINETGIVDIITANMKEGLYNELYQAVEDNIVYRTGTKSNSLENSVIDLINSVKEKMSNFNMEQTVEVLQHIFNIKDISAQGIVDEYMKSDQKNINQRELEDAKNAEIRELKDRLNKVTAVNVMAD